MAPIINRLLDTQPIRLFALALLVALGIVGAVLVAVGVVTWEDYGKAAAALGAFIALLDRLNQSGLGAWAPSSVRDAIEAGRKG